MKTIVTLFSETRNSRFVATGKPSDISDRITRIKRALGLKITHGTQAL